MGIGVDRYNAGKRLPKEIQLGDWPNPAQCLTFAMEIPATPLVETITFFVCFQTQVRAELSVHPSGL